jgi:hypothetical protein
MDSFRQTFQQIWDAYSGEAAWQTVSDLSRYHRIQASPGYRRAAQMVHRRLARAGLRAEILAYPAAERTRFWAWPSFQEWDCRAASLHLVAPEEEARLLADFRAAPQSLIQRSDAFEGEAQVVLLEDGLKAEEYEGLDLAGKVVLTRGSLRRVWELAVHERGAAGILFDGMRAVEPVRPQGDLADARQYTSFWWYAGDTRCFGFVLTPRQGQALRRLLKKDDEPVRIRAEVEAQLYSGQFEVVSGTIPGYDEGEVLVVAHLCHPQPSANDNASGAAAALEAAYVLQKLVDEGELPLPRRTIRFLWMPEMTGTFAYLSNREQDLDQIVAGLNLDMVGEDQEQTGSSWLLESPPDAAASFAPVLVASLRDELLRLKGMAGVSPSHTGLGEYPLYRQVDVAFSGGSDHYVLSDPTVGIPTPMLIQWPDRFYHTSDDTPDRTDPDSLRRAGALAAAYAYWLATASLEETTWLGYEMQAHFKMRVVKAAQAAVGAGLVSLDADGLARVGGDLDRRLAYLLERQQAALGSLLRLAPVTCLVQDLQAAAQQVVQAELECVQAALELHAAVLGLPGLLEPPAPELDKTESEAAGLVPARQVRGPIALRDDLRRLSPEDREAWRRLVDDRPSGQSHTLTALALYWADGQRSVLEIASLVELEAGVRDVELLLFYFRMLEKLGYVTF